MTASRRRFIAALYDSAADSDRGRTAFQSWSSLTTAVRGPLERKRKVSAAQMKRLAPELRGDFEVSRFMFAVETYLAIRAMLLVHLAASEAAGVAPKDAQAEVKSAQAWHTPAAVGIPELTSRSDVEWALECLQDLPGNVVEAEIDSGRDLVKRFMAGPYFDVFQADHRLLIPKELRHTTGTYYTPQWLARYVLRSVGFHAGSKGFHLLRLLDPTCGSGVFLVAAAEELRMAVESGSIPVDEAIEAIGSRILGIDIDPLASVQTRANLSLALLSLNRLRISKRLSPLKTVSCRDVLVDKPGETQVDLVVGNPPWVNWEYLPPEYRTEHSSLWPALGIFDLQGRDKAFSKEDVSALFFAVAVDNYLVDGGRISFLVPQSLVKSALNHRGFRKFALRAGELGEVYIKVDRVDDFVAIRPFEGVANRTILLEAHRGEGTTYPVPYRRWLSIEDEARPVLSASVAGVTVVDEVAEPADNEDITTHWTTGPESALKTLRQIAGTSAYRARTGVFTGGANGVYHLDVIGESGKLVRVKNITERAKRSVENVEAAIEPTFVYPLLRGREVSQWRHSVSSFILLPHTAETRMRPVPESELAAQAPATLDYFRHFRSDLAERAGFVAWERKVLEEGFYACQRIGEYTFSPWKVVWRYIAPNFISAVVGPHSGEDQFSERPVIPNEKLMAIACTSSTEAYYLCGLLSCSFSVMFVESRMISTQIAPHLIQRLNIPLFDSDDPAHLELATACQRGHQLAQNHAPIDSVEDEVDARGADILGASRDDARILRALIRESR